MVLMEAKRAFLQLVSMILVAHLTFLGTSFRSPKADQWLGPDARVLVLTAHPDDEVMFFAPTIINLVGRRVPVWALCLSTGNAEGLGSVRRKELLESYKSLGVPADRVAIIDDRSFPDNMTVFWNANLVYRTVWPETMEHQISTILTFDEGGVSNHPNHISLLHGARPIDNAKVLGLRTTPLYQKYTSFLLTPVEKYPLNPFEKNKIKIVNSVIGYLRAIHAMTKHGSQLVWFRWLYLGFSRYMWVNEWVLQN